MPNSMPGETTTFRAAMLRGAVEEANFSILAPSSGELDVKIAGTRSQGFVTGINGRTSSTIPRERANWASKAVASRFRFTAAAVR